VGFHPEILTGSPERQTRGGDEPIANISSQAVTGESVALLVARRTNNRKVVGSRPTEVVCVSQC